MISHFGRWSCSLLYATAFMAGSLLGVLESRAQQTRSEASVGVQITVNPTAQIDFPLGSGFELYIPSRADGRGRGGPFRSSQAPHLDIAEIPFQVRSNTHVTVVALPDEILDYVRGEPIGKAVYSGPSESATGAVLPYRLRLDFPIKARGRAVPGFRIESSGNSTGSHASAGYPSGVILSGIVYVVPKIQWSDVASRRFSEPGLYKGAIQVTVSAGD